jgi:hypothetical protein
MAAEERRLGDWLSSWAHKDAHAVCAPGLTSRLVRVEFMTRHVLYPHRREMKQAKMLKRCCRIPMYQ